MRAEILPAVPIVQKTPEMGISSLVWGAVYANFKLTVMKDHWTLQKGAEVMVDVSTERLFLDDGQRRFREVPGEPGKWIVDAGMHYSFELCRKRTDMGGIPIDQWWMNVASVYGRGNRARNRDVIIAYFWSLCIKNVTILEDGVQDSYILARLLPYVRGHGSRRVLLDAILTEPGRLEIKKQDLIKQLDEELDKHRGTEMEIVEFRDTTGKFPGPAEYSDTVWGRYRTFADELLGEGRQAIQDRRHRWLWSSATAMAELDAVDRTSPWARGGEARVGHPILRKAVRPCTAVTRPCGATYCRISPTSTR